MTRFIRALLWLRWRSLINTVNGGRRDEMERLARIGGLLVRLVLALVFVPAAIALCVAAFVGGRSMLTEFSIANVVTISSRAILFAVTLAVLFGPMVRTMGGLEPELRRLLLMPISRRALHLADAVSGVLDPWIVPPLLALCMVPVGLASTGSLVATLLTTSAVVALVLSLVALGSAASSATVVLFRDRRRAEWVSVVLVLGLMIASFVPGLFDDGPKSASRDEVETTADASESNDVRREQIAGRFRTAVAWAAPLPSEQLGATLDATVGGRTSEAMRRTGVAWVTALLLFIGSAVLHGRVLDGVESGGRRRAEHGVRQSLRLPGIAPAISEIALTVVRTSIRTVRGRISVFFTAIMLGLIWQATRSVLAEASARWLAVQGPLLFTGGAVFATLMLQPLMLNQFAVDGSGMALNLLAPITPRQLVRGKWIGHLLLGGLALGLCAIVAVAAVRAGHPLLWLAAIIAAIAGFVVLIPIGALLSIVLPKASDLSRIGRDGNPHQLAGLLGALISALIFAVSSALWIVPGVLFGRPLAACALAALGLGLSWAVALPCSFLAARLFERRRENLCLVASGR